MVEDYGIKAGSNLLTNTDKQLNLTSEFGGFKVFKWGNASFTTNGAGVGSVEITHDLGYAPIAIVYRKHTAQWVGGTDLPTTQFSNAYSHIGALNWYAGGAESIDLRVKVDNEKLYIEDGGIGNLANNTTYNFRYYIIVDLAQAFTDASNIALTDDYGFKVSKPGVDVLTAEEYNMNYSSKYKSLQYYANHVVSEEIELPEMFASFHDDYVEAASYIDFNHNLGYAPFFLAYISGDGGLSYVAVPFYAENGVDTFSYSVAGFSDANRVRIYWWRASQYALGTLYGDYAQESVKIKCVIFAEDLAIAGN